jgi:hypothetical protein
MLDGCYILHKNVEWALYNLQFTISVV